MVYCCAFNCTNRLSSQKRLQEGITSHSFPKDEDKRKRWLASIRREFFTVTAYTRICSQHFEQKMFDRTGQTTRLREDAVPTLFDFPSNLKKASTQRAPPKDRAAASSICTSSDSLPADACNLETTDSLATSPPAHSNSDHTYSIPQNVSPRKIKRKLDSLLDMNEQLKKIEK